MKKLQDKVAVVTGGGRGVGKAICVALAREGVSVVVAANVQSEVDDVVNVVKGMGIRAIPFVLDITKPAEVRLMVKKTVESFGKVDILINNAGIVGRKRDFIFQAQDDIWREVIEINLFGTYNCIKAVLPEIMTQKKGRIINLSSVSGKQGSPGNSGYAASKHAIIGVTRSVAAEMAMLGFPEITVNAICPGVTDTQMVRGPGMLLDEYAKIWNTTREQSEERLKGFNIQRRFMDPEEIASMVVYLASDDARGITGQAINVCGGTVFY